MNFKKIILPLIVLSSLISHWGHLTEPPRGAHVWRQCNTLAVAKNFYNEGFNVFYPRVDHRKSSNGITGMPFPAYEAIVALTYKVTGYQTINHRLVQFGFYIMAICFLYLFMMQFSGDWKLASIACFALSWSPEIYYYSITALPDIMALAMILGSLYFYWKFKSGTSDISLVFAICLLLLAGLIKLQYLMFGGFMFFDLLIDKKYGQTWTLGFLLLITTGVVSNWYIHAVELRNLNHLYDFGLFVNSGGNTINKFEVLKGNIISDLPELLIGYGMLPLFVLGSWVILKSGSKQTWIKITTITLILVLFHILELGQMKHHAYYMIPYTLFIAVIVAYGGRFLVARKLTFVLIFLIGAQIAQSKLRIDNRFTSVEKAQVPKEFLDESALHDIQNLIENKKSCLVGPDASGCVYFYFLDTKGWNLFGLSQLHEKEAIKKALDSGQIKSVAIKDLTQEDTKFLLNYFSQTKKIGDFTIMNR